MTWKSHILLQNDNSRCFKQRQWNTDIESCTCHWMQRPLNFYGPPNRHLSSINWKEHTRATFIDDIFQNLPDTVNNTRMVRYTGMHYLSLLVTEHNHRRSNIKSNTRWRSVLGVKLLRRRSELADGKPATSWSFPWVFSLCLLPTLLYRISRVV